MRTINNMMFQFHEGPIKTFYYSVMQVLTRKFQFHEGPIKTFICRVISSCASCFNSMKVRLKHFLFAIY